MNIDEALLKKNFPQLREPALLAQLQAFGTLKEVEEGDVLIQIGQYMKWVPLVLSGSIKIAREDEEGRELLLYYLEGGDTCAMSLTCCFEHGQSHIKAVAEAPTRMLLIPVRYMDEWMMTFPSWKQFVMRAYANRFDELLKTLDALAFQRMDQRLISYLQERAKVMGSASLHITHQAIAYDLNASREAVSRLLKKLEQAGEIRLGRNKVELLDGLMPSLL